jgi:hypothetical protein
MSNRLEFTGSFVRSFFYLLSVNGLLATVLFVLGGLNSYTALILFGLVNIFYLATVATKPFKIVIDQDKLLIEVHYLLSQVKKATIVPLREIECSFNYEVLARGGKAKMLKIRYGNKILAALISDYNGWDDKNLTLIFEQLNDLKKLN